MPNIKNASSGDSRSIRNRVVVCGLIVLVIIAGFLLFHHDNKAKDIRARAEGRDKTFIQGYLNSHDYASYQLELSGYADAYTDKTEYSAAESALNEIITKVPADKITSRTYRSFWYLYQQKGDAKNRKKYALLTAEKLKQEGDPQAAAAFEKDAKGR